MKKYITIALLIVLTVSLLAGCRKNVGEETLTNDTTPSSSSPAPSTTAPTTTQPTTTQPTTTQPSTTDGTNNTTESTDTGRSRFPSAIID